MNEIIKKLKKIKLSYVYSFFIMGITLSMLVIPFTGWKSSVSVSDKDFFKLLDPDNSELQPIIKAANKGNIDEAAELWWDYLLNRDWTHYQALEENSDSISDAERTLQHKFYIVGNTRQMVGEPKMMLGRMWNDINWHDNPYPADNEWIVQLNRFSFGGDLAQAYLNTSNEDYAWEWWCCIKDWIQDESAHENQKSWRTLDTAARIDRTIKPFLVFMNSSYASAELVLMFTKSIVEQARYLRDLHSLSGNWMTGDAAGMIKARMFLPEILESISWEEEAWETYEDNILEDVYPDGSSHEASVGYHIGTFASFTGSFEVADAYSYITPPDTLNEVYAKMVYFGLHMRGPDFKIYNFGDCSHKGDIGAVAEAAPYCSEAEFYQELLYFYANNTLTGEGVMPKTHISFQDRGYYVSRSNWSTDAFGSAMDAGPITGGHGHDDVLSFQAGAYGKQFLIDPGIATYGADPLAGHHRSGWAHNLFIMDDDPNTEANATAIWAAGTYGTSCRGTHNYWGVDASRELVFAPRGYWMVNDFYEGSGSHSVDVLFQLEEYSKITDINNNIVNTTFNNTEDPNMIFGQLSPWDDKMDVYFGNVTGYENFGKITYKLGGTPVPSTTMILEADLNGPSCWNTVLFPVPANNTFNPTFTPLPITLGGTDYLFNETFNSPGIAMAVNTPEGWDIHISLRNSQTIEINDPRFPSIEFTGTQCIISFNSTMGVESIFSSDIDSLVVDDVDIITKTSSLISSSIDKFTIRADSIIPISYYNGTAITNVLFDEDALTIGGYEL